MAHKGLYAVFKQRGRFSCFASASGFSSQRHRGTEARNHRSQMFRNPGVLCPGQSFADSIGIAPAGTGEQLPICHRGHRGHRGGFLSQVGPLGVLCVLCGYILPNKSHLARQALGLAPAEAVGHKLFFSFRPRLKAGLRGKERPPLEAFFSLLPRYVCSCSYSYKGVST
jgi:hypothetical protein